MWRMKVASILGRYPGIIAWLARVARPARPYPHHGLKGSVDNS